MVNALKFNPMPNRLYKLYNDWHLGAKKRALRMCSTSYALRQPDVKQSIQCVEIVIHRGRKTFLRNGEKPPR